MADKKPNKKSNNEETTDEGETDENDDESDEDSDEDSDVKEFYRQANEKGKTLLKPENIVTRNQWSGLPPLKEDQFAEKPDHVIFTYKTGFEICTNPEQCVSTIQQLQKKHMEAGMSDIPYNFIIGGDLRVYEGRGWKTQPDPNYQYPELRGRRLDIGFLGEYNIMKEPNITASDLISIGLELGHYGVQQEHLSKDYRLLETEKNINYEEYDGGKEEIFPELHLYPERYYPGNDIKIPRLEEILNEDDRDINGYYTGVEDTPEWFEEEKEGYLDGIDLDYLSD